MTFLTIFLFLSRKISAHVEKVDTKAQFKHDFSNFNAEEFMDEIKATLNGMIINSNNPAALPWMMQLVQLKRSLMIMHHKNV